MRVSPCFIWTVALCIAAAACGGGDAAPEDASTDVDAKDSGDETREPGATASAEIGPGGGDLMLDGARIVVPEGALSTTIQVTITRTSRGAPDGYTGYSPIWQFAPEGTVFSKPVRVELPFGGDEARATIFWSRPDSSGFTWMPTTSHDSVAVTQVLHFSEGFAADGVDFDVPPDLTCLRARIIEGRTVAPSGIALFFAVDDCNGTAVTTLTDGDFTVSEDGDPLSVEAAAVVLPKPGTQAFVTLALDLSTSTDPVRPQLIASARALVDSLDDRLPGQIRFSLVAFAGMEHPWVMEPHTLLVDDIRDGLDKLEVAEVTAPNGTNLNGAVIDSLTYLDAAQADFSERSAGGAPSTGYLVLFTDGRDTTKLFTGVPGDVADALASSTAQVLAIGLEGTDYRRGELALLAPDGLFEANDSDGLERAFGALANQLAARFERTYLLAYCSPTLAGEHRVEVSVSAAATAAAGEWTFSAEGFTSGCTAQVFETACDGRECGGLACGACDDRIARCDGPSGTCRSMCEVEQRCGTSYVNANGYTQDCPNTPTFSACAGGCVDLTTSTRHCGECWHECATGADCVEGECICPNDGMACAGRCREVASDADYCGDCDTACAQGQVCVDGTCECPEGQSVCDGACRDLSTDFSHCGECGNRCLSRQECRDGACACRYAADTLCDGECFDLYFSPIHCGSCTNSCSDGSYCQAGACRCSGGLFACGDDCADTSNDPAHCGDCDTTCAAACEEGTCLEATQIAAGREHACALLSDQSVRCWGSDEHNQTSLMDSTDDVAVPSPIDLPPGGFEGALAEVEAGAFHTCVRRVDMRAMCWGKNGRGEVGSGSTTSPSNVDWVRDGVGVLTGVTGLASGNQHSCALRIGGGAVCWGWSEYGQLADGPFPSANRAHPIPGVGGVQTIAAMGNTNYAKLDTGNVMVWGGNGTSQWGDGSAPSLAGPVPTTVEQLATFEVFATGPNGAHTCAIDGDGQTWCWGSDVDGGVGNAGGTQLSPAAVSGMNDATDVSCGDGFTCIVRNHGEVWCWGRNDQGQLGRGTTGTAPGGYEPALVTNGAVQVAAGGAFACARYSTGAVACWGANDHHQLGDGTSTPHYAPSPLVW